MSRKEILDGIVRYYDDEGHYHRENGPAVIGLDGKHEWYKHGKRHREDGPALINSLGYEEWWFEGRRHREGGPATKFHLTSAGDPGHVVAVEEQWWVDGKLHREDGPAKIFLNGRVEYWLNGERLTEKPY